MTETFRSVEDNREKTFSVICFTRTVASTGLTKKRTTTVVITTEEMKRPGWAGLPEPDTIVRTGRVQGGRSFSITHDQVNLPLKEVYLR